jgi:two-component system OmpR family sensor kinase
MTLRLRLLLVLVGIVAAGLIVADVVTYTSLRSYLFSQVDQELQNAPQPVESALNFCSSRMFITGPSNKCGLPPSYLGGIPQGTFIQLRDASGNVIYQGFFSFLQSSTQPAKPVLPSSPPISSDPSQNPTLFGVSSSGAGSLSYRAIATQASDGPGDVVIVAVPLAGQNQTLGRLLLIEVLGTLAVLVALGALAWWIVRRGLRPLDEMATTAGAIAAGDLSQRVADVDSRTEVGKLGAALNTMLSEIEQAFAARTASEERLRRFLADASHELRTPLTSIRGYAELFDRGTRDRPEDLATSMRHIREDANRMSVLVDDLLILARLDRQRPLALDPVDLAQITTAAVDAARVAAPERAISLDSPGTASMVGDADRLRQAIDNLLGNAIKHTPSGTAIAVRLTSTPTAVGVEVTDHGPGIPAEERERIFEPFHRADPSRARSSGGVGLGLAIVSAIARAHGGRVGVVSNESGGATFWVQIPRSLTGSRPLQDRAPSARETQASGRQTPPTLDSATEPIR